MKVVQQLLTEHLAIWTDADTAKRSGRGRSSGNAASVYGVKKLRELILELAVRGKLVPQDGNDEPASELLKRIQAEKAKLVAKGKIKKEKPLAPIGDEEKPFELPVGWEWARLNDFVLSIQSGGTPSKNNSAYWNGKIPWASVKDLNVEKFLVDTQDHISKEGLVAGSKLADKGDLLICTRMGLGKIAIASVDVAINQDLKSLKLTNFLDIDYFINFYRTLKIAGSGMTVAGIRQDELLSYCVPTPPLAEQHRIVAKVDELMALCDQLETQHNNAAEAHEKIVSVLLNSLTQSADAEEFIARDGVYAGNAGAISCHENWQRIAAHFDTLFTTEASIDALKQTLLQLAVMGKLVPQDANDEPASKLLQRIQAEKARLVAAGKIKKDKSLAPISDEEKPFELPVGWEWARLGEIIKISSGDGLTAEQMDKSGKIPVYGGNGINGYHSKGNVDKQTLVIGRVGYYCGSIHVTPDVAWVTDNAFITRFSEENIYKTFLYWLLKITNLKENENATAQPVISGAKVYPIVVALPPLAEQHRIVAKVDELMAICDQLTTRITTANQLQQKLADVVVALTPTLSLRERVGVRARLQPQARLR